MKKKISTLMVYATFPTTLLLISFFLHEISLGTELARVTYLLIGIWVLDHAVNTTIKYIVRRDRPEGMKSVPVNLFDYSFPSWHAESAFAFFLGLVLFYPAWWTILLLALPIIVGYNRIDMKHHYLSDVIGGFIVGGGIAILCRIYPIISKQIAPSITYWLGSGNPTLVLLVLLFIFFGPFSILVYLEDEETISSAAKGSPTLYLIIVGLILSITFLILNLLLGIKTGNPYLSFVALGAGGLNGWTFLKEIINYRNS